MNKMRKFLVFLKNFPEETEVGDSIKRKWSPDSVAVN